MSGAKLSEQPALDQDQHDGAGDDRQHEGYDMREDQPVFLVMRALLKKPHNHPQGQKRGDEPDESGQKSVGVFHDGCDFKAFVAVCNSLLVRSRNAAGPPWAV